MSYLEIYNEMIRDLLNTGSGYLDLREDAKGVQVAGLSEHSAKSTAEVMAILKEGNKQRTQEPTAANKTSSRSHAVLIVSVRQRNRVDGIHQQLRVGKMFLIDLAGSERAANTQNRGKRMVEGAHINRSLLALGNCINALSDKNVSKYVNYRDSKLTRLLKDSLGGNCKTVMVAHVSPASFFFEESRNTLAYADRAKNIRTKVRQNVLDMTLHISQYSNIITELREEIRRLKQKLDQQGQTQRHAVPVHTPHNEGQRNDDDVEFSQLRNELQNVLDNQTELRKSLIELAKSEAEMKVESSRLQLELNRIEQGGHLELNQGSPKDNPPFDAKTVKKEIQTLMKDMKASERQKKDIERKLDDLRNKTFKLQEELRRLSNSPHQKEILALLSRIHALEAENTQLQSNLLLRLFDLRRRDLMISLQDHQQLLGSELIQQQRTLIGESRVAVPSHIADLQNVYHREAQDLSSQRRSLLPSLAKDSSIILVGAVNRSSDDSGHLPRLFEPVQKNKQMKAEINSTKVDSNLLDSQRSTTSSPVILNQSSPAIEDLILDNEDRMAMNHATRGITLLAAKRRGHGVYTSNLQPDRQLYRKDQYGGSHLTESRLAQHNRRYNNGSRSNPTSDKHSTTTEATRHGYGPNVRPQPAANTGTLQPTVTFYDQNRDDARYPTNQKIGKPKDGLLREAANNRLDAKLNGSKTGGDVNRGGHVTPLSQDRDAILKRLKSLKEPTDSDKVQATIPAAYGKGDISVTGRSIQQ